MRKEGSKDTDQTCLYFHTHAKIFTCIVSYQRSHRSKTVFVSKYFVSLDLVSRIRCCKSLNFVAKVKCLQRFLAARFCCFYFFTRVLQSAGTSRKLRRRWSNLLTRNLCELHAIPRTCCRFGWNTNSTQALGTEKAIITVNHCST